MHRKRPPTPRQHPRRQSATPHHPNPQAGFALSSQHHTDTQGTFAPPKPHTLTPGKPSPLDPQGMSTDSLSIPTSVTQKPPPGPHSAPCSSGRHLLLLSSKRWEANTTMKSEIVSSDFNSPLAVSAEAPGGETPLAQSVSHLSFPSA